VGNPKPIFPNDEESKPFVLVEISKLLGTGFGLYTGPHKPLKGKDKNVFLNAI
jgi:hypothetical protein